jgi:hypothetical protein
MLGIQVGFERRAERDAGDLFGNPGDELLKSGNVH